ncbi:hypothetical protein N7507_007859 [Penicillium longicatenatum]|nr:hypothetical protein N7507_007859 [Penicillium longicatenatum]
MALNTPPSFLKACQAYLDYQQNLTTMSLPPYGLNADGQVTIQYGKIFYLVPNCQRRMDAFTATNNLRHHLKKGHGRHITWFFGTSLRMYSVKKSVKLVDTKQKEILKGLRARASQAMESTQMLEDTIQKQGNFISDDSRCATKAGADAVRTEAKEMINQEEWVTETDNIAINDLW